MRGWILVFLSSISIQCSSNQLVVAVLCWRGCTQMRAEGGINNLGEKMSWFCLDTLQAEAATRVWRMRIKLNSILDSSTHSLVSQLRRLQSCAANASFLKRCNLVAITIARHKPFYFPQGQSTLSSRGQDGISGITANKSVFLGDISM